MWLVLLVSLAAGLAESHERENVRAPGIPGSERTLLGDAVCAHRSARQLSPSLALPAPDALAPSDRDLDLDLYRDLDLDLDIHADIDHGALMPAHGVGPRRTHEDDI